jgi:hypothetical protein
MNQGETMSSKKVKFTDLNQNHNTELLEEITKEKLEKINGGRWVSFIIGGVEWGQTWLD